MKKLFLAFAICTSILLTAKAQDSSTVQQDTAVTLIERYTTTSYFMPIRQYRDLGFSALTYTNAGVQLNAHRERFNQKTLLRYEGLVGISELLANPSVADLITPALLVYFEFNLQLLKPISISNTKNWRASAGGIWSNGVDLRYYSFLPNNSLSYELYSSLAPTLRVNYDVNVGKKNRRISFGVQMNTALFTVSTRPNYIGMVPADTYLGNDFNFLSVLSNTSFVLPNRFFKWQTQISFDRYFVRTKNYVSLSYQWMYHYSNLPNSNEMHSAAHTFGFMYHIYSFKKKLKKGN